MSTEYQELKTRIEELESQVEALQQTLIILVELVGPDFIDRFSTAINGIVGRTGMTSLQSTDSFNVTLTRLMDNSL